jgi:hypothetical protein
MGRRKFKVEENVNLCKWKSSANSESESTSFHPEAWISLEDKLDDSLAWQIYLQRTGNSISLWDDNMDDNMDQLSQLSLICAKEIRPWKYSRHGPEFEDLCSQYLSYVMKEPQTYWTNQAYITSFERFTNTLRPDRVYYYLANLRYRNVKLNEQMNNDERAAEIAGALDDAQRYLCKNRYPRYLASMEYICGDLILEKGCLQRVASVSTYSVEVIKENIEEAQLHFERSVALMDVARQELFSLGETEYLWDTKRTFITHQEQAHSALRLAPFLLMTKPAADCWDWVQKVKTRGMADMIRSRRTLPPSWETDLETEDPEGYAMLREEQDLISRGWNIKSLRSTNTSWTYEENYQQLLHKMRQRPSLERLMSARGDEPISHTELDKLLTNSELESGREIVYAEWAIFGSQVLVFITRRQQPIQVFPLLCPENWCFDRWISDNLDFTTLSRVDRGADALREISFLVEPLAQFSSNEIIILCPAGPLHRIPLHALEVEGMPLIQRHPVVYTHSASIFRWCMQQKKHSSQFEDKGHLNVHVVADLSGDRETASSAAQQLAEKFKAQKRLIGKQIDVSANIVKAAMQNADILHYHGHATFDSSETRNLGLKLGSGAMMGIRDILDLTLRPGAHVTLIACGSYAQHWTARDEGLGIVPAFFYGGASSAVATLWPAQSSMGALFGELFYNSLLSAMESRDCASQKWNMAVAFQQAILGVSEKKSAPYFWAGFVLTGYWMFGWSAEAGHEKKV